MTQWLLRFDVAHELQARIRSGVQPAAEQRLDFAARDFSAAPRNLRIVGDVAEIRVEGLLTPRPDFLAMLFGFANTTYSSIVDALALASNDPAVKRVSMFIDSPGGAVAGLFDTLAAIEAFAKPISVLADQACSAAYAIAATAGPITAKNAASAFGSIGVATSIVVDEDVVDITSTNAPNKRPDVSTEQGKAVVRAELDALHELFVGAVAKGRRTTAANVNASFGRGGVLLAGEAKNRGMIDKSPGSASLPSSAAPSGTKASQQMDLNQLKLMHPDVYAAAVQIGRTEERSRVKGHMTLAQASGDFKSAHADILSGAELTPEVHANHIAAGINRNRQTLRQQESDYVDSVLAGAAVQPGPDSGSDVADDGDRVARAMRLPEPSPETVRAARQTGLVR